MAQDEIIDILRSNPNKWFCPTDIIKHGITTNRNSLITNFKRLRKYKVIDFEVRRVGRRDIYFYKWKKKNG